MKGLNMSSLSPYTFFLPILPGLGEGQASVEFQISPALRVLKGLTATGKSLSLSYYNVQIETTKPYFSAR